jgi:hypothetical protein
MLMTLYAATVDFASVADNSTLAGSESTFGEWIARILNGVMVISVLMLLVYLLWGGISWISAGGDSSKIQAARDRITQGIIGIIVLAATLAIFMLVQNFLGIELFDFTGGTPSGAVSASVPWWRKLFGG